MKKINIGLIGFGTIGTGVVKLLQNNKKILRINKDVMNRLQRYTWPGNVRELEHIIERSVILSRDDEIDVDDLPEQFIEATEKNSQTVNTINLKESLESYEKKLIKNALDSHNGHRDKAAKTLGINRSTLFNKMKKFNLL